MTADRLQGDVLLTTVNPVFPDVSDREGSFDIESEAGLMKMTAGFETAVNLSLFGGNDLDDGTPGNVHQWWGNLLETEDARAYRGTTQYLLDNLPATSGNLLKIQQGVEADLAWFLALNVASSVSVVVAIPGHNRIEITVAILAEGVESEFTFTENWKAAT